METQPGHGPKVFCVIDSARLENVTYFRECLVFLVCLVFHSLSICFLASLLFAVHFSPVFSLSSLLFFVYVYIFCLVFQFQSSHVCVCSLLFFVQSFLCQVSCFVQPVYVQSSLFMFVEFLCFVESFAFLVLSFLSRLLCFLWSFGFSLVLYLCKLLYLCIYIYVYIYIFIYLLI